MYSVDLHTHTRFFHSSPGRPTRFDPLGADLLAAFGRRRGLDGIALTNHDYYRAFDAASGSPLFLPGIEVSTTDGHVLVVGPEPPARTPPGELTPREVVSRAHEAGCAAIIAHPYRRSRVRESGADFDAVEINGKHPRTAAAVRSLAERLDVPVVGGSDAHFPFETGRAYTTIDAETLTPESVVAAIRDGRVEPAVRDGFPDRFLRKGYRYVHRYWRR